MKTYKDLLEDIQSVLAESTNNNKSSWFEQGVKGGKIKASNPKYEIDKLGDLIWKKGIWKDGIWKKGT